MTDYSLTRDDARERSATVRVSHIDVTVDIRQAADNEVKEFPVTSVFRMESDVSSTFVDIAGRVDSVKVNGAPVSFRHVGEQLFIDVLPAGKGEFELSVSAHCMYSRSGEGLHRYFDPEDGRVYLYTQFEPTDAHRAWPCFDQPDIKPSWQMTVLAPSLWIVTSNGEAIETTPINEATRWKFSPTEPLSSYITALVAGEYAVVDGGVWSPDQQTLDAFPQVEDLRIPLRVMCRQALAPFMDSEDILTVTRQGFNYFHQKYRVRYPWGAYDQIFVPEYNLGAMENPGCVTFNERYLSRQLPSFAERQKRANTILHEMCHMWFGDLATPAWWDDLWLKESFADNQGTMAAAEATQYTTEWASFAIARKAWAYTQDLYPTTHPIAAQIPDINAAKTNFDGITYAKGAAVLKQLVAWVGEDAFFAAAHRYFTLHACGATSLGDLLDALEQETGMDLDAWQKVWLHTTDPTGIEASLGQSETTEGEPSRVFLTVKQSALDERLTPPRPHQLTVSLFDSGDAQLTRIVDLPIRLEGDHFQQDITDIVDGCTASLDNWMVVANSTDETYAVTFLDAQSVRIALQQVNDITDPVTRAVVWSSLWQAVRQRRLRPDDYAHAVLRHLHGEQDEAIAQRLVETLQIAVGHYMPSVVRQEIVNQTMATFRHLASTDHVPDRIRLWSQHYLRHARFLEQLSEEVCSTIEEIAKGQSTFAPTDWDTRWAALLSLAIHDCLSEPALKAYFTYEATGENHLHYVQACAALPNAAAVNSTWEKVLGEAFSNEEMTAALEGLLANRAKDHALEGTEGSHLTRFFNSVIHFWNTHTIGMGIRFVRSGLATAVDLDDRATTDSTLAVFDQWLDAHHDAPHALIRLMREKRDDLQRSADVQIHWWSSNE